MENFWESEYHICKAIIKCQELEVDYYIYQGMVQTNGNFHNLALKAKDMYELQKGIVEGLYANKHGKEMPYSEIAKDYQVMINNLKENQAVVEYPSDAPMKR